MIKDCKSGTYSVSRKVNHRQNYQIQRVTKVVCDCYCCLDSWSLSSGDGSWRGCGGQIGETIERIDWDLRYSSQMT